MHNSSTLLKQDFLKKWIKGVQICNPFKKDMNTLDRKNAIKLTADVAIASTRNTNIQWSHALMSDVVSRDESSRILVEQVSGRKIEKKTTAGLVTCRKIVQKSRSIASRKARRVIEPRRGMKAACMVKKLVKSRTKVLKSLVPGGKELDEVALISETLDYIMSLRVQVDVMRHVVNAAEKLDHHGSKGYCN